MEEDQRKDYKVLQLQKKCLNFAITKKKFCLSLHYNGANSYLFVSGTEIIKYKSKDSEIVASPLCLSNISKYWSTDNMKKTGLTGHVYDFNIGYNIVTVDDIKDIHNCLMKKNNMIRYDKYVCIPKSNI